MSLRLSELMVCLQPYGLLGDWCWDAQAMERVCASPLTDGFARFDVACHKEPGRQLYYHYRLRPGLRLWRRRRPNYHALLPHVSFEVRGSLRPIWVNDAGRAVVAWYGSGARRTLLIGLDVVEELVRHCQGDPAKISVATKGGYGFDFERPTYLFADHILADYTTWPWADYLGFFLAESLSKLCQAPLVEPLPDGARGAVILTGDDDQACLENYEKQLRMTDGVPITYFLTPQTRHTAETVSRFPNSVEIGAHPDALDHPEQYGRLCAEQVGFIRRLTARRVRTIRNHGYLNAGYLGHLKAWEDTGLRLDVNYPGVDGTALNGSFLPMRVRRPDGSWSSHFSLLTLFGDGMLFALNLSERQAARRIRSLARQIEGSYPGVMVVNFHPQNIGQTKRLHACVLKLARRTGWVALGLESYLDWLETLEQVRPECRNGKWSLTSCRTVTGLVLRWPVVHGWRTIRFEPWSGEVAINAISCLDGQREECPITG